MSEQKNVLVTGFGPFRNHKVNTSWEAVKLLPNNVDGFRIIKKEIPVTYDYVDGNIPKLWEEIDPVLVLHVGVSSLTDKLCLEKCANRTGYVQQDCFGCCHPTGKICENGDDCLTTEINLQEICDYVNGECKTKTCISECAGRYLCEYIYYTSLNIDKKKTLFVHVPQVDEPYSIEELVDGLFNIILCVLKQLKG